MPDRTSFGITVMPEYFQTEGVSQVLENLARAGAGAVATSPYVMAPAETGGTREPPADAEAGKVRLLDRSLWGRRSLDVTTAPSFAPDPELYRGLAYQPSPPTELTCREGGIVAEAIARAKQAGFRVHLQVQAAIPPGYRVQFGGARPEDQPRLPDGSLPHPNVDNNGSLASPDIRAYTAALLVDLVRTYPDIDVIRIDWPEYPPYTLDAFFLDFGEPSRQVANRLGFAFEEMRRDANDARTRIMTALSEAELQRAAAEPLAVVADWIARYPGLVDLARFKAALVVDTVRELAEVVRQTSGGRVVLMPQGFPPPWSALSGFDVAALSPLVRELGIKLYTMHWPMMLRHYGDAIVGASGAHAASAALAPALAALLDIADDPAARPRLTDWRYPEPDEPHGVGLDAQRRKIEHARARAGSTPLAAFAHAYGPLDDVRDRVAAAASASGGRVWINRYGYMSDAKLDAVRGAWAEETAET